MSIVTFDKSVKGKASNIQIQLIVALRKVSVMFLR